MPKASPKIELTDEQVASIAAWIDCKNNLDFIKTNELTRRLEVIKTVPFDQDKEEGGQTVKLEAGWRLALDKPMNYKLDSKNNDGVVAALNALHAINPLAASVMVRWEPVLSVSEFKKLSDEEKLILAPVLTMTPGTPSLELKPPPEKKA